MDKLLFNMIAFCVLFGACAKKGEPLFQSLPPSETGIHFSNRITENDTFNILAYEYVYNGGGVGIGDFNNDGLQDVYFTGNMVDNQLYLNKGHFKFEDVTTKAGVSGNGKWNSGVAVVDLNNDGLQDLYVCSTTYQPGNRRANLLYVNQGPDGDNVPIFKELGAKYGIADTSSTTTAAFFDYDNDGDLDLFLAVNQMDSKHSPNTYKKKSTDGSSVRRDKLFRNDFDEEKGHPFFTDVSLEAGITIEGFSLGLNIVDINQDGWKDIYITNDYLTNDLLYVNNGDGTFTDRAADFLKHTSYSAMGNDVVDLNNDALPDIVAVDMLPEDNFRRKTMLPPNNYTGYINNKKFDYQHQYVRNTLQMNQGATPTFGGQGGLIFSEISLLAGISSTDWSWTPMVADFDNDGYRDIIITNGFPKDVTDKDFIDYNTDNGRFVTKQELREKIPSVKIKNYAYRNQSGSSAVPTFEDATTAWGITEPSFSNGAAYADFDNDGDLDYIVNNINDSAFVYKNLLVEMMPDSANWLKVKFLGNERNKNGIGATVNIFYQNGKKQYWENTPYRGYLSSVEGGAHFGLGKTSNLDSIVVIWPTRQKQVLKNVPTNQVLDVKFSDAILSPSHPLTPLTPLFQNVTAVLGINYIHPESDYIDFNVQRLLLHKFTQFGPGIAVSDVNGDGLDDFYVGGSHFYKGRFFIQNAEGQFSEQDLLPGEEGDNKKGEELGILFFDADGDGDDDLYLVHGGYEFAISDVSYQDQLFLNESGKFTLAENALPAFLSSGSCVKAADFDHDGDLDLFVGGRVKPHEYPLPVSSYILKNDGKGHFAIANDEVAPMLNDIGLVCDALWTDFDNDGWQDLLLAGEWMPLQFLKNDGGTLNSQFPIPNSSGLWNSLAAADFDLDGDMDYLAGNLGKNTLLKANEKQDIAIYTADFDGNGGLDAMPAAYYPNKEGIPTEYPFFGRSDVEKQTVKVKGIFPYHADFGEAKMQDYLNAFPGNKPLELRAKILKTSYLENLGNGNFALREIPVEAQLAPVFGIVTGDFNGDNLPDALLTGNDFGMEVGQGRQDAFNGLLLLGDGKGGFRPTTMQESGICISGDGKSLVNLQSAKGGQLVVAGQNQGPLLIFENEKTTARSVALQPNDCTAIIMLSDGRTYREEMPYGNGFLSQSARRLWLPKGVKEVEVVDFQGKKRKVDLKNILPEG